MGSPREPGQKCSQWPHNRVSAVQSSVLEQLPAKTRKRLARYSASIFQPPSSKCTEVVKSFCWCIISKGSTSLSKYYFIAKIKQEKAPATDLCCPDSYLTEKDGQLLMCDWKNCPKVYHLACLGREKMPRGKENSVLMRDAQWKMILMTLMKWVFQ